jgi:hypothetical protein
MPAVGNAIAGNFGSPSASRRLPTARIVSCNHNRPFRDRDHIVRSQVLACCYMQSAGAFRQPKGRDGTSACFRRKQREMRHVEKQLGYHHAGVVVWIRRGHASPIFTGSSARRRASSRRMRRTPYRLRMRLSQLQGMASPRPPRAVLRKSSPFGISARHSIPAGPRARPVTSRRLAGAERT